jgi:hypothetical protein
VSAKISSLTFFHNLQGHIIRLIWSCIVGVGKIKKKVASEIISFRLKFGSGKAKSYPH